MFLLIPILVTIMIRLAASFSATGRIWGVNHLAYFPWSFCVAHALSLLAAFALLTAVGRAGSTSGFGAIGGWFSRPGGRCRRWAFMGLVSAALLSAFVVFGDNTHVLGDGALRLKQMREVGLAEALRTIVPEPADYVLHYALDRYVAAPLGLGTLLTFRLLSYAAGLAFFWTAYAIARRLHPRGTGTGFALCYILAWGGSMMFFGYVEEYALAAAAMLVFFYFSLEYFASRKGILPLAIAFLVCFFLHNFTIVLLPSLIYAALAGRTREFQGSSDLRDGAPVVGPERGAPAAAPSTRGRRRPSLILAATLILVVGWMIVVIAKRGAGTLLLPAAGSDPRYLVWSRDHLADMLNELFLVSPALLMLLVLQGGSKRGSDPVRTFFRLAGASSLLLLALVDPQLGMARDWDLFSLPLLAFHLALFVGVNWSRVDVAAKSAVLVLALSATSLWILMNHSEAQTLRRCENVVSLEGKRGRYGFAMLGDYYFVHERYTDAERMFSLSLQKQQHHDSYLGLAQAQAELGKEAEAVENLRRALDLDPTNPRALMLLGRYYYAEGRWKEAREMFTRLLRTPAGRNDAVLAGMVQKLDDVIAQEERAVSPQQ